MDGRSLIVMGLIGLAAGFLASFVVGPMSWGLLGYLVAGVLGAYVGTFALNAAGIDLGIKNALASQIVTSTIGAIIVVILARILM